MCEFHSANSQSFSFVQIKSSVVTPSFLVIRSIVYRDFLSLGVPLSTFIRHYWYLLAWMMAILKCLYCRNLGYIVCVLYFKPVMLDLSNDERFCPRYCGTNLRLGFMNAMLTSQEKCGYDCQGKKHIAKQVKEMVRFYE